MQSYLRPFYNNLRQQNSFERTLEHQKHFDKKANLTEQISNTISDPDQPFYAMFDASNFGIGAALLQSHKGTNKSEAYISKIKIFSRKTYTLYPYERKNSCNL